MARAKADKELEQYRNLLDTPSTFEDGFGWTTIAGILFCGLIMTPGAIYLGLMTGGNIASAATWVTVILFSEITRRALKTMTKGNLIVLLYAAGIIMSYAAMGPAGSLVNRAYLVTSDAARDMGMRDYFPTWWCPKPDSPAITERNLFHHDWLIPACIIAFSYVTSVINRYTIGYFFFRLCSDVERLPFPMAPISAQGSLALAESTMKPEELEKQEAELDEEGHKPLPKWRIFSLGALIGIAFGFVQVGVPAITGLFLDQPIFLIPQPYLDTTTMTEAILPATPTGVIIDPGIIITGMVLPFWAIMGSFAAILVTLIANPILHASEILVQWQPGMNTVNATFVNSIDFWMSFGFGTSAAIAVISVYSTVRDVIKRSREAKKQAAAGTAATDGISERDKGMYDAINKGIKMATGDIVGILNADDMFESPDTLAKIAARFEGTGNGERGTGNREQGTGNGEQIEAVYADIRFVRDDLQTTSRYYSAKHWKPWMLQWGKMPPHPSVYIRRELFDKLGLYKLGYDIAADYELLIRYLRKAGIRTKYLNECVVRMRMGGKSTRGWRSNLKLNQEIVRGNMENGYFCCLPMLLPKYLFKIFEFILPRLGLK